MNTTSNLKIVGIGASAGGLPAELLFTHLSLRAGRKSTVSTTNLGFDRWTEIFGDQVLTAAMVDRLTHKAILVNMNGKSFRVKESKKII